jgi:hypothetical protein
MLDGLFATAGLADALHLFGRRDQRGNPHPHDRVIVYDKYLNRRHQGSIIDAPQ